MKKLYSTIALCAAAALGAGAATVTTVGFASQEVQSQIKVSPVETAKQSRHVNRLTLDNAMQQTALKDAPATRGAAKAPEATDWSSIGECTWVEDLLTIFSDIPTGQIWTVDVQTSAANPGWYRLLPYASGPIADMIGGGDTENWLYINATNPNKVYAEDFVPFGAFPLSNLVPETEWPADYQCYGTLKDNVISFAPESFVLYAQQKWNITTRNSGLQLYLPGSAAPANYSLTVSLPWCADDQSKLAATILCGDDVAGVKVILLPGRYTNSDNNNQVVAAQGQPFQPNIKLGLPTDDYGINTLLTVALDAEGNVVNSAANYFFGIDDPDTWKAAGKAKYVETIYAAGYSDIDVEELEVEVEESVTTPGRYRLVNPYTNHTKINSITHSTHAHYIYVNATNPDRVFIEAAPNGGDTGLGEGALDSYGAQYFGTEQEDQAAAIGFYGSLNKETGVITIPEDVILLAEANYQNGAFLEGNNEFTITLPNTGGVANVAADNADAPVRFFNLQGQPVTAPAAGTLVIRQKGDITEKVVIK